MNKCIQITQEIINHLLFSSELLIRTMLNVFAILVLTKFSDMQELLNQDYGMDKDNQKHFLGITTENLLKVTLTAPACGNNQSYLQDTTVISIRTCSAVMVSSSLEASNIVAYLLMDICKGSETCLVKTIKYRAASLNIYQTVKIFKYKT